MRPVDRHASSRNGNVLNSYKRNSFLCILRIIPNKTVKRCAAEWLTAAALFGKNAYQMYRPEIL